MNSFMNSTNDDNILNGSSLNTHEVYLLPGTAKHMILVTAFLLLFIGIPANVLVIWTFLTVKRLRVSHNVFVISLAIVDTTIIGYLLPFNIVFILLGQCPLSETMCLINGSVAHICFTTSVQTIMIIAINRYIKICFPEKYNEIFSSRNVTIVITYTWSVGPVFLFPLFFLGERHVIYDATLQMCIFDRYGNWKYTTVYQTLCLALPIVVTAFCYCRVYIFVLKTRSKAIRRHWNNGLQKKRIQQELTVTRSQFAIFLAYLVLYMPFGITAVFIYDRDDVSISLHATGIYLCYLNSCINGVIYGLLNRNIREAYKEAIPFIRKHNVINVEPDPMKTCKSNNVHVVSLQNKTEETCA